MKIMEKDMNLVDASMKYHGRGHEIHAFTHGLYRSMDAASWTNA
jgi:hypothetical protein